MYINVLIIVLFMSISACNYMDMVFIMDSSGSIGAHNWPKMLHFAKALIQRFPIGPDETCIGAVSFGSSASKEFDLDDYVNINDIANALNRIQWKDEMTNTSGGIRVAMNEIFTLKGGDRPAAPNIAVLITDGESNRDEIKTIPEAQKAHASGITLFVVGVGLNLNFQELEGISTQPPEEHVFLVHSFDYLQSMEAMLKNALCKISGMDCTQLWQF